MRRLVALLIPVVCVTLAFLLARAESAAPDAAPSSVQELTVETLHVKHPDGNYTLTLAARPNGAWITIVDGAGRMLVLSIDEQDSGLSMYAKGGKQLVGLGQRKGGDPMLAVRDDAPVGGQAGFPIGDEFAVFPKARRAAMPGDRTAKP